MDHHRSLYKDNFPLWSRKNARLNEQTATRIKDRRRDIFYSRRNILLTPAKPAVFTEASEKDKENGLHVDVKSGGNQSKIEEKLENAVHPSRLGKIVSKSQGPVLSRQEKYLQRFIDYRKKQNELKKTKEMKKQPFVPVANANKLGNAPEKRTKLMSSNALALKENNFKAPKGLKSQVSTTAVGKEREANGKQRRSLYTVASKPPKKKPEAEDTVKKFPIARKALSSNYLSRLDIALSFHTTPISKTQSNNIPVSNGLKKNVGVEQRTSKPSPAVSTQKTLKKPATTVNGHIKAARSLKLPPPPVPAPNPSIPAATAKNAKLAPTTTRTAVRPKRGAGTTNDLKQHGAVGKAKAAAISKRADPLPKSKPNLAVSMKAKRLNASVSSRPIAGAIKNQPVKSKMEKQKLLEVVCQQICSTAERPTDQFLPTNAFGTFVTSTQRKSHSSSHSTLEFLTLDLTAGESISPVEAVEVAALSNRASAIKRQQTELKLAEEVPSNRSRSASKSKNKFNFVRYDDSPAKLEETKVNSDDKGDVGKIIIEPQNIEFDENAKMDTTQGPAEERPLNYLSPYVSVARGKVNSKTEKEKRNSIYLQSEADFLESQRSKESASVTMRRTLETVRYFRKQLADEIQRLHGICEKWETYKTENLERLQETGGDDMINVAIGQTKLLTSKKFKQFSGLIDRCEKGATSPLQVLNDGSEATKPITAEDLEGFWSMVGLQTDNIDKRFANLESWRENDWIDPEFSKQQAAKVRKPKTTSVHKSTANAKAKPSSALQQLMQKMRKKKALAASGENVEGRVDGDVILTPSRKRPSIGVGTPQRNQTESRRVSIIVKDRKLHSAAPTILTITTPKRRSLSQTPRLNSPQVLDSPKLLKHVKELKRSLTNLQKSGDECSELWISALKGSEQRRRRLGNARTPSPAFANTPSHMGSVRKSILKTPGTAKGKPKNVNFNEKLKIKKFIFTIDSDQSDTDENEKENEKFLTDHGDDDVEKRTYGLRTRTVVLRPSSEFEIPQ